MQRERLPIDVASPLSRSLLSEKFCYLIAVSQLGIATDRFLVLWFQSVVRNASTAVSN